MVRRGSAQRDEEFSFVSPVVKYLLFFFNTIFWIISVVLMGIGVYARISKHDAAMACLTVDPSIILLIVGVLMFFLTFCGCVGSLRENICLLQTAADAYWQAKRAAARVVAEAKTRVWEEFGEATEKDCWSALGKFWQTVRCIRRGKQFSANTVYSGCGELLTSTGDIVGWWKEYFKDLLNPTDTSSIEEAKAEDSEFCICLALIFLLQLVAGILGFVFADKVRYKVTDMVNNAIKHYRDDLDLQNLIDFGQNEFACCGGISFKDWSQNIYFNCTEENPSSERCAVPFSCCLISKDEALINTMCGHGMQKLEMLKASDFIHTSGCIDKLVNWIHSNLFLLGGISLGLAIPQLVGILLSQVLINQIQDQIKLQDYNLQHHSDPWS
ncbi:hypothetical protein QTP70_030422 [Hemibagrus guttatus]|uniref:Tetraspanin-33 n=1 Tax=Hemibagrus guttatus TaxID=175788 RepID=A0AAE0QB57_9TELE|nr:hypothetical protein QTP70_030422 [Hemibagrus guttatus]